MNYDTIRCNGRSYCTGPGIFNSKATCCDKLYIQNKTHVQDETYITKSSEGWLSIYCNDNRVLNMCETDITSNKRQLIYGGMTMLSNQYFGSKTVSTFMVLNMNNSDIIGCNVIVFADYCDSIGE